MPIGASALEISKLVKDATLKVYEGAWPDVTHRDTFNADLMEFLRS